MRVAALAGGIGAGKLLRGLVRAVPPAEVTAIVNTGDDIAMHGLHVSPDLDSVTYWLGDAFDRERGWGRRDESFRATEELGRFDPDMAWFNLGDLDLATHLFRTNLLREGRSLSEATARVAARFGVEATLLPMCDDPVTTRLSVVADGEELDLHFQEYWVRAARARRGQGGPLRRGRGGHAGAGRPRGDRGRGGRPAVSVQPDRLARPDPRGARHRAARWPQARSRRGDQRHRRRGAARRHGGQADARRRRSR